MKPRIYLETTIPSYLTAWPSRDPIRAGHQQSTKDWWEFRRMEFDVFVSELVLVEVSKGDPTAAIERLKILEGLSLLKISPEAESLAEELTRRVSLPSKAAIDALHIGIAVVNEMDFLLTWNCTHIANATLRRRIDQTCVSMGYSPIIICTPIELVGGGDEGHEG